MADSMLGNKALAKTGLGQLQSAFGTFAANKQKYPLVHESKYWQQQQLGGIQEQC